jgi:DNA topoisomerase-1
MRTDSTRISDAARNEAVDYIRTKFGEHYIGGPRKYKTSPGAQEAHEAIRPTSVLRTPAALKQWLTPDQFRLYNLIWERFLASQMASQVLDVENVDIAAGKYLLKAQGITVKFAGYTVMYEESRDEENGEDKADGLPPLVAGDSLVLRDLLPKQHFTQPPPRYTEATLVKTLEEKGIGRPSTYAPIVDTIIKREYVELKEKKFHPTKLGFVVTDILTSHFPSVVNIDFTADMEQKLDKIEDGQEDWIKILKDFYGPFSDTLSKADSAIEKVTLEPEMTNEVCDLCGKPMVVKKSRFGKFLACSGYPECKGTKSFTKEIGLKCPREGCPGQVVERRSKKGRFYGCNQYPKCDFVSWGKPTDKKCQRCGNVMVLSPTRAGKVYLKCIDPKCVAEKKGKAKAAAKQEE